MVLEITLGSHFSLRSHFSENSVIMATNSMHACVVFRGFESHRLHICSLRACALEA